MTETTLEATTRAPNYDEFALRAAIRHFLEPDRAVTLKTRGFRRAVRDIEEHPEQRVPDIEMAILRHVQEIRNPDIFFTPRQIEDDLRVLGAQIEILRAQVKWDTKLYDPPTPATLRTKFQFLNYLLEQGQLASLSRNGKLSEASFREALPLAEPNGVLHAAIRQALDTPPDIHIAHRGETRKRR